MFPSIKNGRPRRFYRRQLAFLPIETENYTLTNSLEGVGSDLGPTNPLLNQYCLLRWVTMVVPWEAAPIRIGDGQSEYSWLLQEVI